MKSLKLPFTFDPIQLRAELSQFTKEDYYDIYNPSVTLKTLWSKQFIVPVGTPDTDIKFVPNDALKKCPHLLSIFKTFNCRVETFRIHSLDPGAHIKPHRDTGFGLEHGKVRLHIPIQTNDKVEILVEDQNIVMKEGECWYCNFHLNHEVTNGGDQPRIHLIIDCMVNDWLKGIFAASSN
ncbi:MAG: aspartyl/asparaginyl beta-hydroxylase domain-containing protein [Saprospiraceae bacterium]|nr:aspartyl/asparaginyl beta-hydroxylase domain-containing protein [Saprospiraceae bacterium]